MKRNNKIQKMNNNFIIELNTIVGKAGACLCGFLLLACFLGLFPQFTPSAGFIEKLIMGCRVGQFFFCFYVWAFGFYINKNKTIFKKRQGLLDNIPILKEIKEDISFFKDKNIGYVENALHYSYALTKQFAEIISRVWFFWAIFFLIGLSIPILNINEGRYWFEIFETLVNNITGIYILLGFLQLDNPETDVLKSYWRPFAM